MKTIKHNRIKCKHCGTVIESKHRHDFVVHTCGEPEDDNWIAADGGNAYLRRVGNPEDWEEASEYEDDAE